jgi:hypothetical protein
MNEQVVLTQEDMAAFEEFLNSLPNILDFSLPKELDKEIAHD